MEQKEDIDWNYWVECFKQTENISSERLNLDSFPKMLCCPRYKHI